MLTKLIELEDGTLVEVETEAGKAQPIAGGFADKVGATFENVQPMLLKTYRPIIAAWDQIQKEVQVETLEIELGFSFEGEGNIYVTKATAGANLKVKLTLKAKMEA